MHRIFRLVISCSSRNYMPNHVSTLPNISHFLDSTIFSETDYIEIPQSKGVSEKKTLRYDGYEREEKTKRANTEEINHQ